MQERRCAYYYRAMILLCRASSPSSPSWFYSLDMTRVISYTVDEVFRSCFLHTVFFTQTTVEATFYYVFLLTSALENNHEYAYTTTFFLFLFVLLVVFLDKTRTYRIWALLFKSAFIVKHSIGSTPKKNCLLNTLESAWRDIGGNSPHQNYSRIQYPPLLHLNIRFLYFLPENTDMFLLLGFFFPP